MIKEDIIRMAREAGWTQYSLQQSVEVQRLERFASLVAALDQAEPVAWMVYTEDGESVYVTDNPADIKPSQRALPLFTTRHSRPSREITNES